MAFHNGMFFSTFDRDNDRGSPYSCALAWLGGWWYNDCHRSNLNGEYGNTGGSKGINWYHWKGFTYSMKEVRMLVRKPWPWKKMWEHKTICIVLCNRHGLFGTNFEEKESCKNYDFYVHIFCYWFFSIVIVT